MTAVEVDGLMQKDDAKIDQVEKFSTEGVS